MFCPKRKRSQQGCLRFLFITLLVLFGVVVLLKFDNSVRHIQGFTDGRNMLHQTSSDLHELLTGIHQYLPTEARHEKQLIETTTDSNSMSQVTGDYTSSLIVQADEAFLFSAIYVSSYEINYTPHISRQNQQNSDIVITGWERLQAKQFKSACCVLLRNEQIAIRVKDTQKYTHIHESRLTATQYRCATNLSKSDIVGVSITNSMHCSNDFTKFLALSEWNVSYPVFESDEPKTEQKTAHDIKGPRIGVCVKVAYGEVDAQRLVEWFEINRLFGVDTIITHVYHPNPLAMKVFDYYEKLGLSKSYPFDIPEKDEFPREFHQKRFGVWNDQQVALYDCQTRLQAYDFVVVYDTDEIIVPRTNDFKDCWKTLFMREFKPNISSLFFETEMHLTSWKKADHPLVFGQFINSSEPMKDRPKEVYVPSRVQVASVSTHSSEPKPGMKNVFVDPKLATIHHFRSCRDPWLKPGKDGQTFCDKMLHRPSVEIQALADYLIDRVILAKEEIGL